MIARRRRCLPRHTLKEIDDQPKSNAGAGWGDKRQSSGRVFDLNDYEVQQHLAEEAIYG